MGDQNEGMKVRREIGREVVWASVLLSLSLESLELE
jgi:hypothetical protein